MYFSQDVTPSAEVECAFLTNYQLKGPSISFIESMLFFLVLARLTLQQEMVQGISFIESMPETHTLLVELGSSE